MTVAEIKKQLQAGKPLPVPVRYKVQRTLGALSTALRDRWLLACEQLFAETKNPLFAWSAYQCCREAARSIPEWVLQCFDTQRVRILAVAGSANPAQALAEAFTGKTRTGSGAVHKLFKEFDDAVRDIDFASQVKSLVDQRCHVSEAWRRVADEYRVGHGRISEQVVRRAWNRYRKLLFRVT